MRRFAVLAVAVSAAWAQPGQPAPAQPSRMRSGTAAQLPPALQGIGIDQKLDQQVPLDAAFRDEFGRPVTLGAYFGSRPVILAPVYYECPMLCTQILNGLVSSLKAVSFNPGREFEVVALSFDPKDTPELAGKKRQSYLNRYGRPDTANGWHFLTGSEPSIKRVMDAIGYRYRYDEATRQYVHASGIVVLTPQGRISHYFYGVEYAPRDLRLGLVESSQNKIGSPVDQILLFCYHYDPATGKYGAIAMGMVRYLGIGFVLIAGSWVFLALRRDARAARNVRQAG